LALSSASALGMFFLLFISFIYLLGSEIAAQPMLYTSFSIFLVLCRIFFYLSRSIPILILSLVLCVYFNLPELSDTESIRNSW
jgi:hypothetical protein